MHVGRKDDYGTGYRLESSGSLFWVQDINFGW